MTQTVSLEAPPSHPFHRERELVTISRWLITMRWLAGAGVLLATWFARSVLDLDLQFTALFLVGVGIIAYNCALWRWLRSTESMEGDRIRRLHTISHIQVGLDWVAMALLIRFSGGIESPVIFFFIFHILIASLVFERRIAAIYAILALTIVAGISILEKSGLIQHHHVVGFFTGESFDNTAFVIGVIGIYAITSLVTFYLTSSIAERLHQREDQLSTLYLGAQTVSSTLDLQVVLDRLVHATAEALNVSAASIDLIDSTGTRVDIAAAYGFSQEYLNKGPLFLDQSQVLARVLRTGQSLILQGDLDRSLFQYPGELEREGIRSLLYVPLVSKNRSLGMVGVHSRQANRFSQDDAEFLSAIASQGAVAIDNAMSFQALKKLDHDKSQFVRTVTHELRSPVTGAQSLLRNIIKGYAGGLSDRQRDIMGRLDRRLNKLEALINDLLDLAAGRSDMSVEEPEPMSLLRSLDHVISVFQEQAEAKEQTLIFDPPAEDFLVYATEEGIERIFTNLIGNAIKYTPEGGTVTVKVENYDLQVGVVVCDSGIGIPADSLPKLFEEFYRAPNAKAFETGTGLGLVIVKELVESFSGRISVTSKEGKGTTFTVHLPLVTGINQRMDIAENSQEVLS
ncbi:MAG: HAMP domain-containing sensor histidine kinase [Chloroflexota bacterium]